MCVCELMGAIMRRTGYHGRASISCLFSYHVVVFAFTGDDDGRFTKMFKLIYLV